MKLKTIITLSTLIMLFANSCKNNQSMEQCLATQSERKKFMLSVADNNTLANEMVQIMMSNDNCKNLMRDNIIQDTIIINKLIN